jgi:hypothetical protein
MGAAIAVRGLLRVLIEESSSHLMALRNSAECGFRLANPAEQIKRIVRRTGLTMTQISAATSAIYGEKTSFFVPPTFLYKQREGVTPHICQIIALSKVTGYRFRDWMSICGYDLKLVLALQIELHVERTVLVTPDNSIASPTYPRESRSCRAQRTDQRYVFAKIGVRDAVGYPAIRAGSIVRANCAFFPEISPNGLETDALWLVEHPGGLACCQVRRVDEMHIVLLPNRSPLPSWPLRIEREARILGLVDQELRPRDVPPQAAFLTPKFEHRPIWPRCGRAMNLSTLIIGSRSRAGITLRAAHEMTLAIARLLGNRHYGIALGQLSDYEATNKLPRHIAKIISLCAVYSIDPLDLIAAAGMQVDDSGKLPITIDESGFIPLTSSHCDDRFGEELDCGVRDGSRMGGRAKAASVVA